MYFLKKIKTEKNIGISVPPFISRFAIILDKRHQDFILNFTKRRFD